MIQNLKVGRVVGRGKGGVGNRLWGGVVFGFGYCVGVEWCGVCISIVIGACVGLILFYAASYDVLT
jgi:hypothetical protein